MIRILVLLLGAIAAKRPGLAGGGWPAAGDDSTDMDWGIAGGDPGGAVTAPGGGSRPPRPPGVPPPSFRPAGRWRRLRFWLVWGMAGAVVAAVFRKAIAWLALSALSAAAHLIGVSVHLPTISAPWPWQTISKGVSTNPDLGPWVLQKIQGISSPALGRADFTFYFTHKVSKNLGPLPCWYASTFFAVGYASATVDLNPGPAWWAPAAGHYRLRVVSRPHAGKPGQVAIAIVLPRPRLPRSAQEVVIDNIASKPIATDHSWTYSGILCGSILRPRFPESVLYAQAQRIAFYKSTHSPQITRDLIATAQAQATTMMRDNFIQPTVNALGYTLSRFTVSWS